MVYSFNHPKIAPIKGVRVNNMHNAAYYSTRSRTEAIFLK